MAEGERKLAAIMFTDMVGYTALGQENEPLSLALLKEQRKLIRPILDRHRGREIKTIGDAFLVEFSNALEATRCAYDVQRATREFNFSLSEDRRIHLRIGLHLGDVVENEGDITGDSVNVASRVETLADDGGVCLTRQVYDQVRNKFELPLTSLGTKPLKNVNLSIEVYKMVMPWGEEKSVQALLPDTKRIAVLPFANVSPDPNDDYFADGLTDELIDRLSRMEGLEIIARTSVMAYKNKEKTAAEVGKELRVGTLIEGSVRKAGNKIRITAQFIDVKTEGHLWSSKYDRNLEDIFEVQSDIAEQVARALQVQFVPSGMKGIEKNAAKNSQAYILYLKGRYYWNERTREGSDKAGKYFEEAVRIEPTYALAYAGLADRYVIASAYGWMKPKEAFPIAEKYVAKAMELDSEIAETHAALAAVHSQLRLKLKDSELEYRRAIELNPSYAMAHHGLSILLMTVGRLDEAYEEAKRARDLDPLSSIMLEDLGEKLLQMGKLDEAIKQYKVVIETNVNFPWAHVGLGLSYFLGSRTAEALQEIRRAVELFPHEPILRAFLAFVLGFSGLRDEASNITRELEEISKDSPLLAGYNAAVLFSLGRVEDAFNHFRRAFEERAISDDLWNMFGLPMFKGFRDDPRWVALQRARGL